MIRFGIIGPGKISHRFIIGMNDVADGVIVGCASRNPEKSLQMQQQYGFEKTYTSYSDLLMDDDIDAVYIATPPHTHVELIMLSLSCNKHVLCEKPLMANENHVQQCFELAKSKSLLLMEANKGVYTPIFDYFKEVIDRGDLGEIKFIDASYCYRGNFPEDHFVYTEEASGSMFDVGVYPLAFIRCLFHQSISDVHRVKTTLKQGCDETSVLTFKLDEIIVVVKSSIGVQLENKIVIAGTEGRIQSTNFWRSREVEVVKGEDTIKKTFDFNSEFTFEILHFIQCIKQGFIESPLMSRKVTSEIIRLINQ